MRITKTQEINDHKIKKTINDKTTGHPIIKLKGTVKTTNSITRIEKKHKLQVYITVYPVIFFSCTVTQTLC